MKQTIQAPAATVWAEFNDLGKDGRYRLPLSDLPLIIEHSVGASIRLVDGEGNRVDAKVEAIGDDVALLVADMATWADGPAPRADAPATQPEASRIEG